MQAATPHSECAITSCSITQLTNLAFLTVDLGPSNQNELFQAKMSFFTQEYLFTQIRSFSPSLPPLVSISSTKVRPGLTSPAVTNNPPPTFSFPVSNGNRTIPTKIKPFSITSPKPPPQVSGNTMIYYIITCCLSHSKTHLVSMASVIRFCCSFTSRSQ